jgi:hypothetical protein
MSTGRTLSPTVTFAQTGAANNAAINIAMGTRMATRVLYVAYMLLLPYMHWQ